MVKYLVLKAAFEYNDEGYNSFEDAYEAPDRIFSTRQEAQDYATECLMKDCGKSLDYIIERSEYQDWGDFIEPLGGTYDSSWDYELDVPITKELIESAVRFSKQEFYRIIEIKE